MGMVEERWSSSGFGIVRMVSIGRVLGDGFSGLFFFIVVFIGFGK